MNDRRISVDGNEACAWVAYKLSEICAIYPITPSSTMAELAAAATGRVLHEDLDPRLALGFQFVGETLRLREVPSGLRDVLHRVTSCGDTRFTDLGAARTDAARSRQSATLDLQI